MNAVQDTHCNVAGKQERSSITEKWQGQTCYRHKSHCHSHVDNYVPQKKTGDAESGKAGEVAVGDSRQLYDVVKQEEKQGQYHRHS